MNRRNAITQMILSGAGLVTVFGGYKWYTGNRYPDLRFLSSNKNLIAALAETIIPRTDTPGAIDAGVPDFICRHITDCCSRKMQNRFINGLKDLQQYAHQQYQQPYERCNDLQQEAVLSFFEAEVAAPAGIMKKVRNRLLGPPFFSILKTSTAEGYCTSEVGATQALAYLHIPGHYDPCTTLTPGQRSWAIN